jgi:hypothetical protein
MYAVQNIVEDVVSKRREEYTIEEKLLESMSRNKKNPLGSRCIST